MKKQALSGKHFWSILSHNEGGCLSQCFHMTAIYHVILNWKQSFHKTALHLSTVSYDFKGDTYEYSKIDNSKIDHYGDRRTNSMLKSARSKQPHICTVIVSQNKLEKKRQNRSHLILTTKMWWFRFSQQLMMRSEHFVWGLIPAGLGLGKFPRGDCFSIPNRAQAWLAPYASHLEG